MGCQGYRYVYARDCAGAHRRELLRKYCNADPIVPLDTYFSLEQE